MFSKVVRKIFGSRNDRLIKSLSKIVDEVNAFEESTKVLSDDQLKGKTIEFRQRLKEGKTLDDLLPEAFAVVREASSRILTMRHFDVQLIGGMVLHQGKITEMRTGEGKTLVATLAAYLNALPEKGVHVVTVNDYLARRDASWMGALYHFLGMSTGVINSSGGSGPDNSSFIVDPDYNGSEGGFEKLRLATRKEAYDCDISYGTNNEFGFDYLRDNMAFEAAQRVQRINFAVIDEVDSILIDEARTPLIISGPAEDSSTLYAEINKLIPSLTRQDPTTDEEGKPSFGPGDYSVDEKSRQATLSDQGHENIENKLMDVGLLDEHSSLYDSANIMLMHHVMAALRAHALFTINVDYIVTDGEIVIVDEFTGRTMPGRRWSEGLHQAVEAKEGVSIQRENQTLASITFQNFFRLYDKLSGMTGTADTEAFEFQQIYGLEVVVIPTNKTMTRIDESDLIFLTKEEKYAAVIEDIKDSIKNNQPVLVGTASINISEIVSQALKKAGVEHQVLNAKQHEREAKIVAEAGMPAAVTIATNMAGRGTDIVLGGNVDVEISALGEDASEEKIQELKDKWKENNAIVLKAGGLRVISTERHESRRIDNQLRGRSGRQGDVGSSRFYLSLEDDLMRIFASEKVSSLMQKLGMKEGESIEHPWVNKAIENAQRKIEGRNFDIRKQLLEYDDVANDQRKVIYKQRNDLMDLDDISVTIEEIMEEVLTLAISGYIPPQSIEELWDIAGLEAMLKESFDLELPVQKWLDEDDQLHEEPLRIRITEALTLAYKEREEKVSSEQMRYIEKSVMLQTLDGHWKEHLAAMDFLRQGIHLRGFAQKNPKQEYKREAFEMFIELLDANKQETASILAKLQIEEPPVLEHENNADQFNFKHEEFGGFGDEPEAPEGLPETASDDEAKPFVRPDRKVGRNEPCPCGSGKKYKQCHGKLT